MTEKERDFLGKLVREVWIEFAKEQEVKTGIPAKPHHLLPWSELDEDNKEVDRRIGERLYRLGQKQAVQEVEAQLLQHKIKQMLGQ